MDWFKGPVNEAITKSKLNKLIFMVYVYDSSDDSNKMNELWNNRSVYTICNANCVSLKLEALSEACKQFSQIFKILCFPSTFFIENGEPVEIIASHIPLDELINKLNNIFKINNNLDNNQQENVQPSASVSNDDTKKNLDERVAMTKEKIKMIQEKKALEEEEKSKKDEIERRKIGQELARNKKEKEEQDHKRIADEIKREKLENEMAKKRILEQIERDREERKKKFESQKFEEENRKNRLIEERIKREENSRNNSENTKIQFKLIDGSTIIEQFKSNEILENVRKTIQQKLQELNHANISSFTMHSTFPKLVFDDEHMKQTLRELELVPTATILIMPSTNRKQKQSNESTRTTIQTRSFFRYLLDYSALLLIPVSFVWNFFANMFNRSRQNNRRTESNEDNNTFSNEEIIRKRNENLRKRDLFKKDGNINQFKNNNDNDDDDDNATWNGNSTQQM